MRRFWEDVTSLRATAVLLSFLFVLLLVNVLVPQQALDPAAYARAASSGPVVRFLLEALELGHVVTSVPFVAVVVLFFVNLTAVLADRIATTIRRIRAVVPTPAQLDALRRGAGTVHLSSTAEPPPDRLVSALRAMGYRTAEVDGAIWGVKHRLALLGFPVFHASFFLLCAGALQIYVTRGVVTLVAAEGQTTSVRAGSAVRIAPVGPMPERALRVDRIDVKLQDGRPVDMRAVVALEGGGSGRTARINEPAKWGDLTVLVQRAGIAPVLWLLDDRGYALDRVVVPTSHPGGLPTRVRLGGEELEAVVPPVPVGNGFPERAALPGVPVSLRLDVHGRSVFDGRLRPGESVQVGGRSVRLDEVRYWVGLRLVRERGGHVLVAGFVLAIAGIIWRMLWFRREIAVIRREGRLEIMGRAEFFPSRMVAELELLARGLGGLRATGSDR